MSSESEVSVYLSLAEHYDRAGDAALRDRYMVLAADAALTAGRPVEAERLRQRLLRHSRSHLLAPYPSFVQAQSTPDVQLLITELRRSCPPREARRLLETLRQGKPAPPPRPQRPASSSPPPTAGDLAVELDSTWLPEGESKGGADDLLERTGDIDIAAALGEQAPSPPSDRPGPAAPAPMPQTRPRPVPAVNHPFPPASARPAPPRIQPLPPPPSTPEPGAVQPHAWVATVLAIVAGAVGLALAAYSLVKPFVQ
jgi:hypothetical protein